MITFVKLLPKNYVHLQSIGDVPGRRADELKPGDTLIWNGGDKSKVVAIVKETAKTITIRESYKGFGGDMVEGQRTFKKSRYVVVADIHSENELLKSISQ